MNISLKGCIKNIQNDMVKKRVSTQTRNEFDFVMGELISFIEQLRDRKSEGEAVIDEFLEVLCMGQK